MKLIIWIKYNYACTNVVINNISRNGLHKTVRFL